MGETLRSGQPEYLHGGIRWPLRFAPSAENPFQGIERTTRDVVIMEGEKEAFRMNGVEAPAFWSDRAVQITASKYLVKGGIGGVPSAQEKSVFDMVWGIANAISDSGFEQGYFDSHRDRSNFAADLAWLLIHQYAAFNSPVWFNVRLWDYGIPGSGGRWAWDSTGGWAFETQNAYERPQCSACQPWGELIQTEEGLLPIGRIVEEKKVGLRVRDGNGWTKVVATKSNGRKGVYRVRLADGFEVRATGDHVVCAHEHRRTRKEEWVRVDSLSEGMFMRVCLDSDDEDRRVATEREVAEAALAGWLQTDGFVGRYEGTNSSMIVEFETINAAELRWVLRHLDIVFPGAHRRLDREECQDPKVDYTRVRLYGEHLVSFVEKYGLEVRNPKMVVPDAVLRAPRNAVIAYLRSVFQADGYVSLRETTARVGLSKCSDAMMRGVQRLLARLGIYSRVLLKEEKRADRYDQWCVTIGTLSERQKFADLVGFIGADKIAKLDESLAMDGKDSPRVRYSPIESIHFEGEQDVYDIQTESGQYLSGGVLVHNCFIIPVEDTLLGPGGLQDLFRTETVIFKGGSGAGTNFSKIREKGAPLNVGGFASGLLSFLEVSDKNAGAVKSAGVTRRAAKIDLLNLDHPESPDFIWWKAREERKAKVLMAAGYSGGMEGEAYTTISGQNANNSVRATDDFMYAVENDGVWSFTSRVDGHVTGTVRARELWRDIARAAWECADPGIQFDTTINRWNMIPRVGRINGSNPCAEHTAVDDSSCNLASLRLTKFLGLGGNEFAFDFDTYEAVAETIFVAQDILIDYASYPTKAICEVTHLCRHLGLGYADLGALLMLLGLGYGTKEGRDVAASLTALLTAKATWVSSQLAQVKGPFGAYEDNKDAVHNVLGMHSAACSQATEQCSHDLALDAFHRASALWGSTLEKPLRNAQMTLAAPTGTISFLMDCDTTGIEPVLGHITSKKLIGGGRLTMVNRVLEESLRRLGYSQKDRWLILEHVKQTGGVSGCACITTDNLAVFDTAFPGGSDNRYLEPDAHLLMLAALQPFFSAAMSKTINLPADTTVEQVEELHFRAWKLGIKCVAIYRDGCKGVQPLETKKAEPAPAPAPEVVAAQAALHPTSEPAFKHGQRKLPKKRRGITWALKLDGHKVFVRTGEYEDGTLGEVFVNTALEGSTLGSLLAQWAKAFSVGLQYGVPFDEFAETFLHTRFDPMGRVENHETIRRATSITDLVMRVLAIHYYGRHELGHIVEDALEPDALPPPAGSPPRIVAERMADADTFPGVSGIVAHRMKKLMGPSGEGPPCYACGAITARSGNCHVCPNCGTSQGCS